ncbi:MAG: type 4a pilus biogenesis protein PilO [bacterium]|nr:type 4a pilus biogenesis protein PilO [bacterium]
MFNLTKKQQYVLAAFTFPIMFCVIFYMYVYAPLSSEIENLEKTFAQKKEDLEKGKLTASKMDVLKGEHDRLKIELSYIEERLPRKQEMPSLLKQVTIMGKSSGVEFTTFKPLSTKKEDYYEILPIEVTIEGTYHRLGKFLSEIASLPRIITPKIKEITAYTEFGEEEEKEEEETEISQESAVDMALKGDFSNEEKEAPKIKKSSYTITTKLMMKTYIFREKKKVKTEKGKKEDEGEEVPPDILEEPTEEEKYF